VRKDLALKLLVGAHVDAFGEFFHLTQADLDDAELGTDEHVMNLLQHNLAVWEDARMSGDHATALKARQRLADVFEQRNQPRNALHHREQALATAKAGCAPEQCCAAMCELGTLLLSLSRPTEGEACLGEMLALAEKHSVEGEFGVPVACKQLAYAKTARATAVEDEEGEEGREALAGLHEAQDLSSRSGDAACQRHVALNLGGAYEAKADYTAAKKVCEYARL
jgi:hypothetical protein